MAEELNIQIKEQPIIVQFTKQGIQGATGATGPQGRDGDVWELQLTMTAVPDGTLTMKLFRNGEICNDQHYAFVQYMTNEGSVFAVSSAWSRNFTGSYSFTYTGMRAFFVIVYEDAFLERVICANSVNYGKAATVRVGTVVSGSAPSVTNRGTIYDAILDFVLEKGDRATVQVGTTTTVPAGTPASVVMRGTVNDAIFDFYIPNGAGSGARYLPDPYSATEGNEIILDAGWYYEPAVSAEGILSWTNNAGLDNPESVQIAIRPVGAWSNNTAYKRLDLVYSEGNGYLAKRDVPSGTALTNPTYWLKIVDKGDKGDAATITAGTATVLPEGTAPTVTNSGDSHDAVFNFGIPKGDKGDAATVTVGSVTTLASGEQARVTNSGTAYAAILNFALPQGPHGVGIHSSYEDEYIYFESGTHLDWGEIQGSLSNQTDLQNALNAKAPLASPALTGTPTAPTPAAGDDSTQIATTAFVQTGLANKEDKANLKELAYVDDADSDGKVYGRKDGDWYNLDSRYYTESEVDASLAEKTNESVVSDAFNPDTAYAAGSYCIRNNVLYRFTQPSQNAWNVSEVDEIASPDFDGSNNYSVGDIVFYNGAYYIFTSAHIAQAGWNENEVSQITAAAFDDTANYSIGDYVFYNDGLYRFTADHSEGSFDSTEALEIDADAFDSTREYAAGEICTYGGAYYLFTSDHTLPQSPWNPEDVSVVGSAFDSACTYEVGDYVSYEGSLYQFTSAHVSGAFDESEVEEIGFTEFDPAVSYAVGDVVSYSGDYYVFTAAHIAEAAWNAEDVSQITADAFDDTAAYSVGDYVLSNGALYRFTSEHTEGAFDDTEVEEIPAEAYDGTLGYAIGDYCLYGGEYYIFTSAHPAENPWNGTDADLLTVTAFDSGQGYSIGEYVVYDGSLYRFTTAHVSGAFDSSEVSAIPADAFDGTANYSVGDYCEYDGDFYVFTSAHTVGTWNSAEVEALPVSEFVTCTAYADEDYVSCRGVLYRFNTDHSAVASWDPARVTAVKISQELKRLAESGGGGSAVPSGMGIGDIIDFDEDTMVITSAENSISDLQQLTAPLFSTEVDYAIGEYVIYDNRLYRFTRRHSAGLWSSSEAIPVNVGEELAAIRDSSGGGGGSAAGYTISETNRLLDAKADNTVIADTFDERAAYAVGDLVMYEGVLYRFVSAHTAGAWDSTEMTAVTLEGELALRERSSSLKDMAYAEDADSDGKAYGRRNGGWYDLDNRYYTEQEVDAALSEKADGDDVYSKTESDTLLGGKSDFGHGHGRLFDSGDTNYSLGLKWSGEVTDYDYPCVWANYTGYTKVIQAITPANFKKKLSSSLPSIKRITKNIGSVTLGSGGYVSIESQMPAEPTGYTFLFASLWNYGSTTSPNTAHGVIAKGTYMYGGANSTISDVWIAYFYVLTENMATS